MISEVRNYKLLEVKSDIKKQEKLQKVYYDIFGEYLTISCGGCIQDAIFRINYYIKKQNTMKEETKSVHFKLKDNVVLYVHAIGVHITNSNLTDDLAVRILKLNRKNLGHFAVYPQDINRFLENYGVKKPSDLIKNVVAPEIAINVVVEELKKEPKEEKKTFTLEELMAMRKSELLDIVDDFKYTIANNKIDIANAILKKLSK